MSMICLMIIKIGKNTKHLLKSLSLIKNDIALQSILGTTIQGRNIL